MGSFLLSDPLQGNQPNVEAQRFRKSPNYTSDNSISQDSKGMNTVVIHVWCFPEAAQSYFCK